MTSRLRFHEMIPVAGRFRRIRRFCEGTFVCPDPILLCIPLVPGKLPSGSSQGRFLFGAGQAASCGDLPGRRAGHRVAGGWREAPRFTPMLLPRATASASPGHAPWTILQSRRASARSPALLGQDGEVAQGQVTVDALVEAAELVGRLALKKTFVPNWPYPLRHWGPPIKLTRHVKPF